MTTNNPPPSAYGGATLNTAWLRVPGLTELNALLNYVPKPAMIADRGRGIVLGANHSFLLLTAFDIKEVLGQPVGSFLSGLALQEAMYQDQVAETLRRRMRDPIPVTVQVRSLDGSGPLVLVLVNAEIISPQRQELLDESVSNALMQLTLLPQEEAPEESVQLCAEIIAEALDASLVSVYQASADDPNFSSTARVGDPAVFPENFTSADMIRLSEIQTWQPGKRMHVELHRSGRMRNLNFVSTAPLGQAGMWLGLLAVGGSKPPADKLETYLDLFSAQVTRIIEHHLLVTELKRQISEAWQSLVVSQAVMDNMTTGILQVSAKMEVQSLNPAAEWMLGYTDWEVRGQPVENVLIGPDTLPPALTAAARGIPTHTLGNVSLHRRNGQTFAAHVQTIPVGQEGQEGSLVVFITDISENEEIRQRSQQLEQRALLGEVTAVFAHEVRNPINNLYSGLQLFSASLPAEDPNQENLARLQNDCLRLNHLMESVLNFSRTNKYSFEKVDLQLLLQRLLDRWRPRFSKVNVISHFTPIEGMLPVAGDARALEQVFTNLISNAVEAMTKNGGNLAIRMEIIHAIPNRPQVRVSVSDDGPGIPDDIRDRIFEPFVTTKNSGTGLGLAITKRIVTAHHGSIQVNTFPGGTVFEVILLAYINED
jgi:two-component system, NtrC family, sensor histidine kinase AtoS